MEIQHNSSEEMPLKPNKSSPPSPSIKCNPSTSSAPITSTSKVLIITPEQIAKLGLTQQINKVVQSQVTAKLPTTPSKSETEQEVPRKRNVRISKITVISPKPIEDANSDLEKSKNKDAGAPSTSAENKVASIMKNKLSNLLKARSTSQIPTSTSETKSEISGRKRKQENLETSSSKIIKTSDDDDVVLGGTGVDAKVFAEEHSTKFNIEEPIVISENVKHLQQNMPVIVKNENSEVAPLKSDLIQSLNDNEDGQSNLPQVNTPTKPTEIKRRPKIKSIPNIFSTKNVSIKSNSKNSLPTKENKISIQEQQPKEESHEVSITETLQSRDDVKPKIHVLSNEQISLPHTYIASLKSHLPDRSCVSNLNPFFIYKSPNPNSSKVINVTPVINLVEEESGEETNFHLKKEIPDGELSNTITASEIQSVKQENYCVEDILVKSEPSNTGNEIASKSAPFRADAKKSIINLENLDKHFIDKDTIVVSNDSRCKVFSDSENEEVAGNSAKSSHSNTTRVKNLIKYESNIKPNLPVIDLTESVEEEDLQKKIRDRRDSETLLPECSQNYPIMKSPIIKNFAAKIRNKLEIADSIDKELKISNFKKTSSRISRVPTNLTVNDHSKENRKSKNQHKNSEAKPEIPHSLKIEVPVKTKPIILKCYSRKSNLSVNRTVHERPKENSESSTIEKSIHDKKPELKSEIPHSLKIDLTIEKETSTSRSNETSTTEVQNKDQETNEIITSTPKKLAHKKKTEIIEVQNNLSAVHEQLKENSEASTREKSIQDKNPPKIAHLEKIDVPVKNETLATSGNETNNAEVQNEEEDTITTPKKRGRQKKSEIIEVQNNLSGKKPIQDKNSELEAEIPPLLKIDISIKNETSDSRSIETSTTEVQIKEANSITEHQIKEANEIVKPAPKKRGRKKKSEMVKTEIIEVQNDLSEPEVETSKRGRKRKVVNYLALSEGKEFDAIDSPDSPKKPKRSTTSSCFENVDGIVEIDTIISCNPDDNSINCTYSAQEITPVSNETPKRKRGRRPRIKAIDNIKTVQEKTNSIAEGSTPVYFKKTGEIGSTNKLKTKTTEIVQTDTEKANEINSIRVKKTDEINLTNAKKIINNSATEVVKTNETNTTEQTSEISPVKTEKTNENTLIDAEKTNEVLSASAKKTNENSLIGAEKTIAASSSDTHEISEIRSSVVEKIKEDSSSDTSGTNSSANESSEIILKQNEGTGEEEQFSTSKKKRGRPWGKDSSITKKAINTIFQHINTSTTESSKDEVPNEANVENADTENSSTIQTIFVKEEFKNTSFDTQPDENQSANKTKKKQGRKKATNSVKQPSTASSEGSGITCAVCSKEVAKAAWGNHKLRFHNNLTWRVGEPPLDLNDQKFVMSVLADLYKRRKPLYCEKCGESKKSVLGFLSHKSMCQKSTEELTAMRVKCQFCDRTVLPVSMSAHLKFCKGVESGNSANCEENVQANPEGSLVQGKREAAKKAHDLIKSLKEDGTIETVARKARNTQRWHVNFDFRPTFFGKKRFRTEIIKNGIIKCRFEECQFETSDVDEIANHLSECDKKPTEGYTCKFCITTFKTDVDVLQHLKEAHKQSLKLDETSPYSEERSEEEDLDGDEFFDDYDNDKKIIKKNISGMNNRTSLMHGIKFLLQHRYCPPNTHIAYPPALDWTLKFCKQNFSLANLFPNWRTTLENWEKLRPTLITNYLPHLKYSACTSVMENKKYVDPLQFDHAWKRYKLFEAGSLDNGAAMFFCGGPIFAMAWAPTPYEKKNCVQILAVSANCDIDKGYTLDTKYYESGLIQFWNCGSLLNESSVIEPPKLEFCIAHDCGPIWHLEWCPSGCYDVQPNLEHDSLQRLGVLAVGSANSHIYLYSVCSPGQISGKVLKPKPILKLVLDSVLENTANDLEAHVTKISWSKASGHQYLLAGYANGMVAIYYLNTTSSLLKLGMDQDGIQMIMPYRVFSAHHHAITVLSLYHLNDGKRWILTGSIDRTIKYWDLENPIVPISNFMKFIVTDGVWLNHWLSTVHCFDDSCAGGLTYTAAHQLRNFESDSASVMHSNSRVMSITGSDWLNGFVQGNVAGEIKGFFPHQMFYAMDGDKSYRIKKVILGYNRLVEKDVSIDKRVEEENQKLEKINSKPKQTDGESSIKLAADCSKPEPIRYKEAEEKYGIVFCDMALNSMKDFSDNISSYYTSNKSDKLYSTRPNIYPMQSITKVAFNPNQESFLYLATGYQAGFVKISYMQFLSRRRN